MYHDLVAVVGSTFGYVSISIDGGLLLFQTVALVRLAHLRCTHPLQLSHFTHLWLADMTALQTVQK